MVGIPPGTERDVLKGMTAHIPIYADATYLFIFRTTASGIAAAINTLSSELAAGGARTDGSLVKATLAAASPADILLQPIFNPVGGYASYIVPAAFVLILQQTLLIGAAMLTGVALAQAAGGAFAQRARPRHRAPDHLSAGARALSSSCCRASTAFRRSATRCSCSRSPRVFILATSFMGQAAGAWFKRPETPTLIFLGTSLPQFFLTGFAWPREAIPEPVQAAGYIFPADLAIDGLVRLNQLGASLWEVARDWRGLWCLAVVYFALAVMSARLVKRRQLHMASSSTRILVAWSRARRGRRRRLFPVAARSRRRRSSASCARPRSASRPRSAASSRPSRSRRAPASAPATSWPSCPRSS